MKPVPGHKYLVKMEAGHTYKVMVTRVVGDYVWGFWYSHFTTGENFCKLSTWNKAQVVRLESEHLEKRFEDYL